jgi:hypothetical protein
MVTRAWSKFVSLVLVLLLGGAAHACACVGMKPVAAVAQAPVDADPHACCKDPAPAPEKSPAKDPCENCNLRHAPAMNVPDRNVAPPAPELLAILPFDIESDLPIAAASLERAANEDVPIPPLLSDLFHLGCQLTS